MPTRESILLAALLVLFPGVLYVSTLPVERFNNDFTEWGNRNSEIYKRFAQYRDKFGVQEHVILSWEGCSLDDHRLDQISQKIEAQLDGHVKEIAHGRLLYLELRERLNLKHAAAVERLRGCGIGADGHRTSLAFNLTEKGRQNRSLVNRRLETILHSCGLQPNDVFVAGLGHNIYTLDKEGLESPFRMVPQIMLLAFLLTLLFIRHFWLALSINAIGTFTGCLPFNFIEMVGAELNAITWPLPTLTMLLTVSTCLHFLAYYRNATNEFLTANSSEEDLSDLTIRRTIARSAVAKAIKPTISCTLTTAMGLLSLQLSTSTPVRQFGGFGAVSVIVANSIVILVLPAFLTWVGYAKTTANHIQAKSGTVGFFDGVTRSIQRFKWPIVTCTVIAFFWLALGVSQIKTGSDVGNFFPKNHRVLKDIGAIERSSGPLNAVELLIQFDGYDSHNERKRIQGLTALVTRIKKRTDVEACLSPVNFAPAFSARANAIKRARQLTQWNAIKQELVAAGWIFRDENGEQEIWRISCRYSALTERDLKELTGKVESIAAEFYSDSKKTKLSAERVSVSTTGEFVLFDHLDRQFFHELLKTYLTAFGLITLIVWAVLRSPWMVFVALPANLFPAVAVLGAAGHFGAKLDVASLLTASVALGIAVDDTLHFLMWQTKNGAKNEHHLSTKSIAATLTHCGPAIVQTSLILGLSIVLYAFCGFLPTVRFGLLLSAMLLAALVGDCIVLPATLMVVRGTKASAEQT